MICSKSPVKKSDKSVKVYDHTNHINKSPTSYTKTSSEPHLFGHLTPEIGNENLPESGPADMLDYPAPIQSYTSESNVNSRNHDMDSSASAQ